MNARRSVICALAALLLATTLATLVGQPLEAQSTGTLGMSTATVRILTALAVPVDVSTSASGSVAALQSGTSNVGINSDESNNWDLLLLDPPVLDGAFQVSSPASCPGLCLNSGICSLATPGSSCTIPGGKTGICVQHSNCTCSCSFF